MSVIILGISAFYHDSAACIIKNNNIVAAAQEERFTRIKHDSSFPVNALKYVLSELDEDPSKIDCVAFYDKPLLKFERLLETYHAFAPRGVRSFIEAVPVWLKDKLHIKQTIQKELQKQGIGKIPVLFPEHHLSHAASAFFPSPFHEAAILTIDGVGEWATTTVGQGIGNSIQILREIHFPHSLGLLYSAFTYYCGFKVNSGEYKLMGLAPYGQPNSEQTRTFIEKIESKLIDIRPDGSFLLNMEYFDFATRLRMTNNKKWKRLFDIPPRKPETEIQQAHCNLAMAAQQVTEKIIQKLVVTAKEITGSQYLVMSGGVALNCVANGKLLKSEVFRDIWIQPAAGDAGGALGASLAANYLYFGTDRMLSAKNADNMQGTLLGPSFSDKEIYRAFSKFNIDAAYYSNFDELCEKTSHLISEGKVIGWFQGRMEFGPRALGNRSILADPRNPEMQKKLNLQIKNRESFRPFAPAVLAGEKDDYFEIDSDSPYMLLVCPVKKERTRGVPADYDQRSAMEKLSRRRSDIPAVTHVDYSARIQTIHKEMNEKFYRLTEHFKKLTGCPVLINTSFNVRGEPIVCTPEDAIQCFINTEMDYLVMGNYIAHKAFGLANNKLQPYNQG